MNSDELLRKIKYIENRIKVYQTKRTRLCEEVVKDKEVPIRERFGVLLVCGKDKTRKEVSVTTENFPFTYEVFMGDLKNGVFSEKDRVEVNILDPENLISEFWMERFNLVMEGANVERKELLEKCMGELMEAEATDLIFQK